jgi:[acyl-carrier-protein] S-malonyltransferase
LHYFFQVKAPNLSEWAKISTISYESAKSVYNELDLALNRPLSDLIFEGSDIDISLTTNSQPAIMATSIAIFRTIQAEKLIDTNNIKFVAGHSLGEYSSLVVNESLEFSDAAKLLKDKIRGNAREYASGYRRYGCFDRSFT